MEPSQLNLETLSQLLSQQTFPGSVEATLITIREFSTLPRQDLTVLVNRFLFCHHQTSQQLWIKTLNNIQELHTLDIIRQFLDNQIDANQSTMIFQVLFVEILSDNDHPWFTLYYNLFLKFFSLVLSFGSERILTIIAQWFLGLSNKFLRKIFEFILNEHLTLLDRQSIQNLCLISPLFSLVFINQICQLLNDQAYSFDREILIDLLSYGLTNSAQSLIRTLETNHSNQCNFLPSIIEFDVSSRIHYEHVHTSILSFLFSIMMNSNENLLSRDFFHQLARQLEDKQSNESIEHYLQIYSICRMSLTNLSIRDLGKEFSFLKTHPLYEILEENDIE